MSRADYITGGGDLSGVVDAFPGDAGVVLQTNVGHTRAGDDEIVEILHCPVAVNEGMKGDVANGGFGIANDHAGVVDGVGVAVGSTERAEIGVVGAGAAK